MATETKIDMKDIPTIELPKFDVTPFIGKRAKIQSAEIFASTYNGKETRFLKVLTNTVTTLDDEKKTEVKASKILSLQKDKDGNWGMGEGTKIAEFFKLYKVKKPEQLIGKEVVLQATPPKDGKQFLTFN